MADEWRFIVEDILTRDIVCDDFPLEAWSCDDLLNRPGALKGQISLRSPFANEQLLDGYRRAIYMVSGDNIEFGGYLLPPSRGVGSEVLSIQVPGWLGYWDTRFIRTNYQPVAVDQFVIFKHLIDDAQDVGVWGPGYDLGIDVVWDSLSGVLRDNSEDYRPFKQKRIGEALRQLGARVNGFDFAMDYALDYTLNQVTRDIRLYYPRKGRTTGALFEFEGPTEPGDPTTPPTNVLAYGYAPPKTFAWAGDGWGDGQDVLRLHSAFVDETKRNVYPPFEAAPSWTSTTLAATLAEQTDAYFTHAAELKNVPILRLDPDRPPLWGDYSMGDTVNVHVDDGFGSVGRETPEPWRIVGRSVNHEGECRVIIDDQEFDEEG